MNVVTHVLPALAVLAGAAVYGADLFALIVLRGALSEVDDRTLTVTMGRVHKYGDRRMPAPFATSVLASVLSVVAALMAGRPAAAVASAVAVLALLCWIGVYLRVSAPINRALTAAAVEDTPLPDARALQARWDGVVPVRFALQTIALAALCATLALA